MASIDLLAVAAALAHSVPGAELRLRCADGDAVLIGTRPDADLSPCALRGIITTAITEERRRPLVRIASIEIGGSLADVGGGVVATRTSAGIEQRWVGCRLQPGTVLDLLDEIGESDLRGDAVHARLTYDRDLAVTVLAITAQRSEHAAELDAVAAQVAASCMAAELIRVATGTVSWTSR